MFICEILALGQSPCRSGLRLKGITDNDPSVVDAIDFVGLKEILWFFTDYFLGRQDARVVQLWEMAVITGFIVLIELL